MLKQPVMMSLTAGNSMMWRYVILDDTVRDDAVLIQMKWFTSAELAAASEIYIEYMLGDEYMRQPLKYIRSDGGVGIFEKQGKLMPCDSGRVFTMNYEFPIKMLPIEESQKEHYSRKAMTYNMDEKNHLSHKIRAAIPSEPPESRTILRFMLELNNKLDRLLDILDEKEDDSAYQEFQGVALSTEGFIFFHEGDIKDSSLMYTVNILGDGEERFSFAAVMEIIKIKPAPAGFFYSAKITGVKNDVIDGIVKYLFVKERDMMRNVRELWEC